MYELKRVNQDIKTNCFQQKHKQNHCQPDTRTSLRDMTQIIAHKQWVLFIENITNKDTHPLMIGHTKHDLPRFNG